jgi:hypothetical protein
MPLHVLRVCMHAGTRTKAYATPVCVGVGMQKTCLSHVFYEHTCEHALDKSRCSLCTDLANRGGLIMRVLRL